MDSLPIFLRLKGRAVILLGDGDAAAAKRRLLERASADVVGEAAEAALAIVAIEDDGAARAAVARLKARGILVNATDRPELCDFTLPAIVDRAPVLVAIGTGGASAGLAKALRQRIETLLPADLGALATALHQARSRLRALWPDPTDRRRAIDTALDPGGAIDPLLPQTSGAVDRWLDTPAVPSKAIVTITLRSADPDDLTLGEARWLARADRIATTGAIPPAILARARADAAHVTAERANGPGVTVILVAPAD